VYSRIQSLTVEQLLSGTGVDVPPEYGTFEQAQGVENGPAATLAQMDLGLNNV
jgi:hypothetical protein